MHPAVETAIYAGVIPAAASAAVTVSGLGLARKWKSIAADWIAGVAAAAGLQAAFAVANFRLGLAAWAPDDGIDWLLWVPAFVAVAAAIVASCRGRRRVTIPFQVAIAAVAAWLLTPTWQSLGGKRWLWMAALAGTALGLWLIIAGSMRRARLWAPILMAAGCVGEALLLAYSGNLRLADFAVVGASTTTVVMLMMLVFRGSGVCSPAVAAASAHLAGVSVLLAALAVYGALLNYSELPNVVFFAPLVVPLASAIPASRILRIMRATSC